MTDELPPVLAHMAGYFSIVLLQIGHDSGLLAAVLDGGGTPDDVARRAGVDRRNAAEWLSGMTAAGHLEHDDGTFRPTAMTSMTFGPDFPINVTAGLAGLRNMPEVYADVLAAVASGAGIPGDRLAPYAPFADMNTPLYRQVLVGEWLAAVPGLTERLEQGGRVAEIAPGNGAAASLVGAAFPEATVTGYDLAPKPAVDLPANVSLRQGDARHLPDDGPFDLVYCLDSLHHMSDPVEILTGVRRVLVPGGVVLIAENDLTGDLDQDVANPGALIGYTSSILYCLQEALHEGGEVHSCAEGTHWVVDALERAGFDAVDTHHSESGYAIVTGTA